MKIVRTTGLAERSFKEGLLHIDGKTQVFEEMYNRTSDIAGNDYIIAKNRPSITGTPR
jgi:hypothetical protein